MTDDSLIDELRVAREELFSVLDAVSPESLMTPGLVGAWSGRELIAHLGYWAGHATEVIHTVEQGRVEEVGAGEPSIDELNETVARVARQTDLDVVRRREAASVGALTERIAALDPGLLVVRLPSGATLAEEIRDDGSDHYREHADDLRRALTEGQHG